MPSFVAVITCGGALFFFFLLTRQAYLGIRMRNIRATWLERSVIYQAARTAHRRNANILLLAILLLVVYIEGLVLLGVCPRIQNTPLRYAHYATVIPGVVLVVCARVLTPGMSTGRRRAVHVRLAYPGLVLASVGASLALAGIVLNF